MGMKVGHVSAVHSDHKLGVSEVKINTKNEEKIRLHKVIIIPT